MSNNQSNGNQSDGYQSDGNQSDGNQKDGNQSDGNQKDGESTPPKEKPETSTSEVTKPDPAAAALLKRLEEYHNRLKDDIATGRYVIPPILDGDDDDPNTIYFVPLPVNGDALIPPDKIKKESSD